MWFPKTNMLNWHISGFMWFLLIFCPLLWPITALLVFATLGGYLVLGLVALVVNICIGAGKLISSLTGHRPSLHAPRMFPPN